MQRNGPLIVLVVVLALVACAVVFWPHRTAPTEPHPGNDNQPKLPALQFTDVTDAAGLRFEHVAGWTKSKLLPETMGAGVAVIDFDRDGRPDLFFVNSRPWPGLAAKERATQALYRNRGDGNFEDVTLRLGLDIELYGMGVAVGDYDNDGWPDLLVTAVGGNRLFRNAGGTRFDDATVQSGLPAPPPWPGMPFEEFLQRTTNMPFPSSAAFVDYDADGALDLFVCNYLTWSPGHDAGTVALLPGGTRAYVPPQQFPGVNCTLYRNSGGGKFDDVSAAAGIHVVEAMGEKRPVGKSLGVVVCDADDDGWPDLIVANDTVRNFFFHNVSDGRGGRQFKEDGLFAGLAYADGRPRGGMGIDAGELLPNDLAVVVANFTNEPNSLFRRLDTSPVRFADTAPEVGLAGPSRFPMKFGAMFFDCDRDGRLDLFVANGHLEPDIAVAQAGQTHPQRAQLFWNSGDIRALLVPAELQLFPSMVGRGCAFLDYDGDGDLDVVVTENGGRARLFRNDTPTTNRALRLTLSGNGKSSNRDAIGAAIEVHAGSVAHRWYVSPTHGYLSQSEMTATIGLGVESHVERVSVRWPGQGGVKQEWRNLGAGKSYRLMEGVVAAQEVAAK